MREVYRPHLDAATVKTAARGRWLSILPALAPSLADAVARVPRHVACPVHGGRDGFRLFGNAAESGGAICNTCGTFPDGFALLGWLNGWRFPETLRAVAEHLGVVPREAGAPRRPAPALPPATAPDPAKIAQEAEEAARRRGAMLHAWAEARPIDYGDPVALYLERRRLNLCGWRDSLRTHPGMVYFENGQAFGPFPVMLARIDGPDGSMVGLHRTYLTADGHKAPVVSPKKIMRPELPGATRGGAVRLFEHGPVLAVAEGIETALAVKLLAGLSTWAAVSAGGMEAVAIPREVREVYICADHDANGRGEQAARRLAARLLEEGRKVRVALPPQVGQDWADVWALEAEHGPEVAHDDVLEVAHDDVLEVAHDDVLEVGA